MKRARVERADQLPRRTYRIPGTVSGLLADTAAVAALARAVRADLEKDLRDLDIGDPSKVREYHTNLAMIATLEGELTEALAHAATAAELQDKAVLKILSGYQLRAIIAAKRAPASERANAYVDALCGELDAMPMNLVRAELTAHRAALELQSANIVLARAEQQLDPTVKGGLIPAEIAIGALALAYVLHEVLPHRDATVCILAELVDASEDGACDIWRERAVELERGPSLVPVAIAIWDSGVDVALFSGQVWRPPAAAPGANQDGQGIAWNWRGEPARGLLRPLEISADALAGAQRDIKGYTELEAGLDSAEARALRARIASFSKDDAKRFAEAASFFVNYAHGTHVAGIAMAGNPAARLLVIRCDQPWRLGPPPPDDAWAEAQQHMLRQSVAYLVAAGARVANMSWNLSPRNLEQMLVSYAAGSPDSCHRLARRWFDAMRTALEEAIVSAPEVLFVAAAGNRGSDSAFHELIPSSFDLPNTLTAGAVDSAGDEAAFTSLGKVDVYANGVHVKSVLPGGVRQAWSGTSMAAPHVTNLAAKLLARYPALGVPELKRVIIEGAEERAVHGRTLRLLHPKRSFELAAALVPPPPE